MFITVTAYMLMYYLLIISLFISRPSDQVKSLSRVRLFATPWTVAYQASPSMGFPRQEYWNGLPFPSPGDLSNPGIEPTSLESLASPALAGGFFTTVDALSIFLVKMHSSLSMFYSCFKLKLLLPC